MKYNIEFITIDPTGDYSLKTVGILMMIIEEDASPNVKKLRDIDQYREVVKWARDAGFSSIIDTSVQKRDWTAPLTLATDDPNNMFAFKMRWL